MLQPYSENFRKIRVNDDDGTHAADFAGAQMYVYQGDSGGTGASWKVAGAFEAVADTENGVGVLAVGKTSATDIGFGVYGQATVNNTADAADARAIQAVSNDTHAGADNIAFRAVAQNGANNYSFYGAAGSLYNAGRTLGYKGSDVTSANDITLGQGNFFGVLGTTTIERIASAGWTDGSVITLGTAASVQISNDVAAGGGFNQIALSGSADIAMTAGSTLTLIMSSTKWKEVSRMLR